MEVSLVSGDAGDVRLGVRLLNQSFGVHVQLLVQGAAHTQSQWESWRRRSMEAKERGEPFDEPPPGLNGRENGHTPN